MPPSKKNQPGGAGRTKQQREDAELLQLQELAQEIFQKKNAATQSHKGGKVAPGKAVNDKIIEATRIKAHEELQQRARDAHVAFERAHAEYVLSSIYTNEYVTLKEGTDWFQLSVEQQLWIRYDQFKPQYLPPIVDLLTTSLSEPYNSYTYEYFLNGWPDLGLVAFGVKSATKPDASIEGKIIATAVSKASRKQPGKPLRGYIAMLAVDESFRGHRLGQRLVTLTVDLMKQKKVAEVCLETPVSNARALNLYLGLGFIKHKYLTRYYLDGQDAVRLKLWLASPFEELRMSDAQKVAYMEFRMAAHTLQQLGVPVNADLPALAENRA